MESEPLVARVESMLYVSHYTGLFEKVQYSFFTPLDLLIRNGQISLP